MKNWKTFAVAFLLVEIVCAALAWLGGFNFDRRGGDVFIGALLSLWVGVFLAGFSQL